MAWDSDGCGSRAGRTAALAAAGGRLGYGTELAGSALCALAEAGSCSAPAYSRVSRDRSVWRTSLARCRALPDVRRTVARHARGSLALGVSGAECSDLRCGGWKTRRLVFHPGFWKRHRPVDCASAVSFAIFPGVHIVCVTRPLD